MSISLTGNFIESFSLSIFFAVSMFSFVLIGILVSNYSKITSTKKCIKYFLIILITFLIHTILDTYVHFFDDYLMLWANTFFVLIFTIFFLITIFKCWKKLNKFWTIFSSVFIILCVIADVSIIFYQEVLILEFLHFLSMFAIFVGLSFLIIKFFINNS